MHAASSSAETALSASRHATSAAASRTGLPARMSAGSAAASVNNRVRSLLVQEQINKPAAADVRAVAAAMIEDGRDFAAGILKCVAKDRHQGEVARFIHLSGERDDRRRAPLAIKIRQFRLLAQ